MDMKNVGAWQAGKFHIEKHFYFWKEKETNVLSAKN